MNVLFLTLGDINDIDEHNIYTDLLREFTKNKHHVYIVSPSERRKEEKTHIMKRNNCSILKVRTGNIQKTNIIEKGIATVMLETQYVSAIKRFFKNVRFDLVLYSTPPITLAGAVKFVKDRDRAKSYLLLKDIFPQNAVDIGIMSKNGIRGLLYMYFRKKEKKLYTLSDYIGCMSQANVDYVIKHNPEINKQKVEVCPNCIEPRDMSVGKEEKIEMRKKYDIPVDKTVFIYGGNLGKPQGIPFLIECLKSQKDKNDAFFLIVGDGTEYRVFDEFIQSDAPKNVKLMNRLPKEDYDKMVGSCDIGMIFLDHRFTIPNFPSRLLSYMQAKMPVLAVTDTNTDIGKVILDGGFGWWCESNDVDKFGKIIGASCQADFIQMGSKAWDYLNNYYSTEKIYSQMAIGAFKI